SLPRLTFQSPGTVSLWMSEVTSTMFLRTFRTTSFAFLFAASIVPLAACSGATGTSDPPVTASNTTTGPLSVSVHGPAKRVADALAQVPLRSDQRATIEQLAKDSETRMEPARKARGDLMLAIADQVQKGTIDRTALQPKIDAVAAAHQTASPGNRAAFEKLHDLLTPEQRVAFVNAMQAEHHEHQGQGGEGMRGRMQKWAGDLGLSQDQQDQIKTKMQARWQAHFAGTVTGADPTNAAQDGHMMAEGHKMHEQYKAMLDAFKTDNFKMDQVAPVQDHREMANGFAGHMLGMLETALPVLTPEQRTIAANKVRERANKFEEEEQINEAPAAK
ncbi:MAG TPA: Spy/CpxP family protein refolding chaperone, partial [Polyangiaceae bacterium]